ncbi:hypothetical protein BDZ91DRAFT_669668 [Kalaharituber pfeilii]|nr:hypothetical protein BDZ91DRAFT_669668 [Kalaharituber pfeilii]
MRPAFHQTYRDLNSAIPSNPASVDPAALSGPPDQGVSKYPVIEAVYLPPNQPNFNTFIPSSPISTLYNPIPQELPRITRRRSAKTKSANNGKGTHEKYHPYQQRNTARVTQRIGFESISDTGCNIPGCHVLTPTMFESHSGEGSGFIGPLPDTRRVTKEKTKRRPMGEEERAAVRHNRITGVCFRCKKYKEKCRGGFPCERCTKLPLWQPICVSTQFAEKKVFSRGLYRARVSQQIGNVKEWITGTSGGGKVALVSNGFEPILRIHVHEYQAKDSSLLDHIIWRGDERSSFKRYPSTAFGILEEASLHRDLDCYIDEHIPVLMDELSGETQDNIYVETMKTAYRYVQKRGEGASFVLWALRIWAAQIVFFKRPWRIAPHSDTLGMSTITEQDLPKLVGLRPLPRLLNQQLDCIMEKRAAELEHLFLTDLQNRIFRMQPAEWFGIFLAMFVFFSSLERDTWNLETWDTEQCDFIFWETFANVLFQQAPRPIEWPLRELPGDFADRNRHLVDTLTSHFRAVTKGHAPFSLEWKKQEIQEKVEGDELVVQYMLSVGAEVKRRADLLKQRIKSQYSRENQDSLNMKFTSRLVFDADP